MSDRNVAIGQSATGFPLTTKTTDNGAFIEEMTSCLDQVRPWHGGCLGRGKNDGLGRRNSSLQELR